VNLNIEYPPDQQPDPAWLKTRPADYPADRPWPPPKLSPFGGAALAYALVRGWRVHPLRARDKKALLKDWPAKATADPAQVVDWWRATPDANVGLVPGSRCAGLAIVDVDPRNGGLATWEGLRARLPVVDGYVPALHTIVVRTGSGGYHVYFDATAVFAAGGVLPTTLGPGVELHAHDNLNIVAPPSIHPDTGEAYAFTEGPDTLAPFPRAWLTAPAVPAAKKIVGTDDVAKARHALAALHPRRADAYGSHGDGGWLDVGMALKSVGDDLLPDWDDWSRQSAKYAAGECERRWATFKPKADGLTLASLIAWAYEDEEAGGLIFADTVAVKPVDWLWYGRVAFGKPCGLVGLPDQGKDVIALDVAARLSRGRELGDGRPSTRGDPRPTYYLSVEDALADTLKPRFLAAGGDPRYLVTRHLIRRGGRDDVVTLDGHLDVIRRDLARIQRQLASGPGLIVLSPFDAFLSGRIDSWKSADIRRVLAPVSALITENGWALLVIAHLTKGLDKALVHRIAGSQAFAAALRVAYIAGHDPADPTERRRLLVPIKRNLLPPDVTGLAFQLDKVPTPGLPPAPDQTVPTVTWGGETRTTGSELLLGPGKHTAAELAEAWLLEQFTERGTAAPDGFTIATKDLEAWARHDHHAWNTVRKQLPALGAEPVDARDAAGKVTGSLWRLPRSRVF